MSEYNEDIDDIMRHYSNSNEAEKREMFEDLLLSLYAEDDDEATWFFWKLVLFWVVGALFVFLTAMNQSALIGIDNPYSYLFSDARFLGVLFLAIVSWSAVVWFCVNKFKGRTLVIILCLLAFASLIP